MDQNNCVTIPQQYGIMHGAIYTSVLGVLENQDELKHGLLSTERNNLLPHRDAINKYFKKAEEESVLFAGTFNEPS